MPAAPTSFPVRSAGLRALGFLLLWAAISSRDPAGLVVGALAAVAATAASLRLLPPGTGRLRPAALARFALRFLRQSIIAGIDVARRALDPRLPLRPGFVVFPTRLPEGPARRTFASVMSLLPGSLPAGIEEGGGMLVHCLDIGQPVAAQLAAEEAVFLQAIRGIGGNG